MNSLTSNQRSFIELMKNGDEYERRGFELLLKRPDFSEFFEALSEAGLFDPERNPGPMEADKPGYYRVPYWQPLAYLEATAKLAGDRADLGLADKVMTVVRSVSQWRDSDGKPRDNHNTWWIFAKILGLLPTSAVTATDLDFIPVWLTGRFDRSMVGHSIASGTLRHFLTSDKPDDWGKACRILHHCTAVEFPDDAPDSNRRTAEARTIVDDFWLKELISASAPAFGKKVGQAAADVFLQRLKETYARSMGGRDTWLFRPAIEEHQQNYDWRGPYNRFVEGLRDTMLAWIDTDPVTAKSYVEGLIASECEIVERIAIHLVDQRFEALRELVPCLISPTFFTSGHRHELHLFLKTHFRQFDGEEQTGILAVIRALPLPDREDDAERVRCAIQQNWLSAMAGQGYEPVDTWLAELNKTLDSAKLFARPDFNSYHEMRWGSGPTPHNVQELVAFARAGTIVERVNAFTPTNTWDGPSKRSLADALTDAVAIDPKLFADLLPQFLKANREYQYAVIAGFKKLWDAWDGKQPGLRWTELWPKLMDFFEALLTDPAFWEGEVAEEPVLSPTRDWIPPVIAEFLRAGSRDDDKAHAPDLLPRSRALLKILLEKATPEKELREGDAFNGAINTSKGKAIEALFDHALRCCRLADKATKSHAKEWSELQPLFDAELALCQNANFEFSAIAGAYISNLYYLDAAWVGANFQRLFPTKFPANCFAALDGLAFAPPLEPLYTALITFGVLDWVLRQEMKGEHARENLLQRMGLAYLWGQEELEGPRFAYLFEAARTADLEDVIQYFWMVRGQPLTEDQKALILKFWDHCVTWAETCEPRPAHLLSQLSLLVCYLEAIDSRALRWLLAVAPHTSVNYNADRLIEELGRLAETSPVEAGQVLTALLRAYEPSYDFEDRLKRLITILAGHAASRADALKSLEHVRYLPGMIQLYGELSAASAKV